MKPPMRRMAGRFTLLNKSSQLPALGGAHNRIHENEAGSRKLEAVTRASCYGQILHSTQRPTMTNVVMPQMGESIAEGTIVRWMKKVGEPIDRDEPLFEISTDKVDAEIPSPAAGVLPKSRSRKARRSPSTASSRPSGGGGTARARGRCRKRTEHATVPRNGGSVGCRAGYYGDERTASDTLPRNRRSPPRQSRRRSCDASPRNTTSNCADARDRHRAAGSPSRTSSAYLEKAPAAVQRHAARLRAPVAPPAFQPGENVRNREDERDAQEDRGAHGDERPYIAARVFGVRGEFSAIEKLRRKKKADYEAAGAKLTYTAFIAKAAVDALGEFPIVNASLDGDNIVYKRDINIGIAVALDGA